MLSPIFNLVVTSAFGVSKDVILITSLRPDTQMYTEKTKTEKKLCTLDGKRLSVLRTQHTYTIGNWYSCTIAKQKTRPRVRNDTPRLAAQHDEV